MSNNKPTILFSEVLYVNDEDTGGLRIKVRLPYEDGNITNIDDLPWVFPLLPKMLHINPKVGELVLIILQNPNSPQSNRFFIGPIISQPYFMSKDDFNFTARSLFTGSNVTKPLPSPYMNPENDGTLLKRDSVGLQGRYNEDIELRKNEIRLRCGFKEPNRSLDKVDSLKYNRIDLGYIQLRYDEYLKDENEKNFKSLINIVADRINLLTHDSIKNFNLTDREELIDKDELKKIMSEAHPLVFGDMLINFLNIFIKIFLNHTHPFAGDPPSLNGSDLSSLTSDLSEFLSKNIKIN